MLRTAAIVCGRLSYFVPMFLLAGRSLEEMRDARAKVRSESPFWGNPRYLIW